jgi:RNA polymerase sigma-70 factor (ECF subfamily)
MILLADRGPAEEIEQGTVEQGIVEQGTSEHGTARANSPTVPTARQADERLEMLYRLHCGPLFAYLVRVTMGDSRQAEDVMQETFLRAWRFLQQHSVEIESFRPWLYTVARHLVIDRLRARMARPTEVVLSDLTRLPAPEDQIQRLVVQQSVRRALMTLRPEHRAVLVDVYYRGLTTVEVAEAHGIPVGTVKSRIHYGLRALRAVIAG